MARRKIKVSKKTIFASLLMISVVLLLTPRRHTRILNDTFVRVTNPIVNKGPKTACGFLTLDFLNSKQFISKDIQKLNNDYLALKAAYGNAVADLRTANQQIEKLTKVKTSLPQPGPGLIFAEVTNASLTGTGRELLINKGAVAGVKKDQYVLAKDTIIGTIQDITQQTSRVRLVTDARHNIEIMFLHDEKAQPIRGQLFGQGTDSCDIPLIYKKNNLRFGDIVYAAAKQGFLYTPRVIGTVSMVHPSEKEPLLWDITVRPIHPANQITEVAIIVMDPDDIDG
ncbi:MAG: hypothetical protein KAS23_02065 [Anaerohalosphaera sp.]|nr:hypothetical protein [Anaerohalosphaera sp.]